MNREDWLSVVAQEAVRLFHPVQVLPFRITCGWPVSGGLGRRRRVVGQCFGPECSKGKVFELFISPTLDKPLEVAGTLCHELAHVAAGVKANHGKEFVKVCKAVGLTKGKPFTVMPGPALNDQLCRVVECVGAYPHTGIVPVAKLKDDAKKSRISLVCPECSCKVQLSIKDLDRVGAPVCGCGVGFVEITDAKG